MKKRIVLPVVLVLLAGGSAVFQARPLAVPKETWAGTIDLHQGDTGTIEFIRENGRITGKIIVRRGEATFETPIQGEWAQDSILFNRTLSATSDQPFKGTVTSIDPRHVKIEGQFAAGFSGTWTSECALLVAGEAGGGARRPKPEKVLKPQITAAKVGQLRPFEVSAGPVLDVMAKAPQAKWTNAWLVLGFPGDAGDSRGFARFVEQARLEDGKVYPKVLETHPHWQPRGLITGRYANVRIPESGAELRAGIGFLEGASGSDGVYFSVRGEFPGYSGNDVRREYFKTYDKYLIADFSQDLSRFKGLEGTLIISVDAGTKSAGQDWAVWLEPKIVSFENEYKFASFVGGGVGSGRDGGRLLNAWGGKSGQLYGTVTLYLLFANIDMDYSVRIESYYGGQYMGARDLGTIKAGQSEMWQTLQRTNLGEWRERIIFNGTYVSDLRYTIAKGGE
jgi:hypothetical protein